MQERYLDTDLTPKERAEDLLSRMSLEQKFAQLQCAYLYEVEKKEFDGIGHLGCLFAQTETAEEFADMVETAQRKIVETSAFHIPAIVHQEALTGAVIPESTVFQTEIGQGATWDPESVKRMAEVASRQFRAVGLRQALSPVMDVCREPRWGRIGETYGEDPVLGSAMSVAFVKGMQGENLEEGVAATGKHFLGYGVSEAGINTASSSVAERMLREVHAKPFQAAITEANLTSVMNSYGSINGEPIVGSKKYMYDLLRGEMGFTGTTVSDYTSLAYLQFRFHVAETLLDAGKQGLEAGLDVECPQPLGYSAELLDEVRKGNVDEAYIDRACLRTLMEKFRLGLFENPYPDRELLKTEFHKKEYEEICLENARKSLVLLKNNGILPLKKKRQKIAVIGPHMDSMRQLFGGYTWPAMKEMYDDFSFGAIAGAEGAETAAMSGNANEMRENYPGSKLKKELPEIEPHIRKSMPHCHTVLEEIRGHFADAEVSYVRGFQYTGNDRSELDAAVDVARDADVVIVSTGGKYGWGATVTTGECMDAANIGLPGIEEEVLEKLVEVNPSVVVLHFDGRPISSPCAEQKCAAILECWNPGMFGGKAIAEVLTGDYSPGGKLPVTVAVNSSQLPIYYNHENGSNYSRGAYLVDGYTDLDSQPLYYFGYGLSYTSFAYSDLVLEKDKVSVNDDMKVRVRVENTGAVTGDEVVQLYVRDCVASVVRPVKQLEGFKRVMLKPGESREIVFTFPVSQLAFLNGNMEWAVEKGEMEVQIGASSQDIRQKAAFFITEDAVVDGKKRGFCAKAEVLN